MNFFRLAIRNIAHYKRKSFIVGVLIIISIIIMIIGNSIIDKCISTLKESFTEILSGDIVIRTPSENEITLFGSMEDSVLSFLGYRDVFGNVKIPTLPSYKDITAILSANKDIECFTPVLSGNALISDTMEDSPGLYSSFFGIEPESYYNMFGDQIELVRGKNLDERYMGVFLSETNQKTIENSFGFRLDAFRKARLISAGTGAIKIRELDVMGIFNFKHSKIKTFNQINLVNAVFLSDMIGAQTSVITKESMAMEDINLMSDFDNENFFSDVMDIDSVVDDRDNGVSLLDELESTLTEKTTRVQDTNTWHFILIRIKNTQKQDALISSINKEFKTKGIKAEAISWKKAAGSFFVIFGITRIVLNTFISILLIVIVFILMNTLVISIVERTAELGTMRALGAKKAFIIKMFVTETLLISIIFGSLGSLLSLAVIAVLNGIYITAANEFFELLFSGNILSISPGIINIIGSFITIIIVSVIATIIYPVGVALRIQPITALDAD